MADKLPAMQFYTGDWLKDPALRSVPLGARGLWMDMLSLMFESPRRGYLAHRNGSPISPEQLARMVGASADEVTHLLLELETCGVFSRTDDGVIFSRRLVRDEQRRQTNRLNGQRGGNPALKQSSDNRTGNRTGIPPDIRLSNRNGGSSSSSSVSSSTSVSKPPKAPGGGGRRKSPKTDGRSVEIPQNLDVEAFRSAWSNWLDERRDRNRLLTDRGWSEQLAELSRFSPEVAAAAIRKSIASGWEGLFPEKINVGTNESRTGGQFGGVTTGVTRAKEREREQLSVIAGWLSETTGVPEGGLREGDRPPLRDEADG